MDTYNWILKNRNDSKEYVISNSAVSQAGRTKELDITLTAPVVSRMHAEFIVDANGRLHVKDLSCNGTFINRQQIIRGQLHQLFENDEVGLGAHSTMNTKESNAGTSIFTVRRRLHNEVIVVEDDDDDVPNLLNGASNSSVTSEDLLQILGFNDEDSKKTNNELAASVKTERSESTGDSISNQNNFLCESITTFTSVSQIHGKENSSTTSLINYQPSTSGVSAKEQTNSYVIPQTQIIKIEKSSNTTTPTNKIENDHIFKLPLNKPLPANQFKTDDETNNKRDIYKFMIEQEKDNIIKQEPPDYVYICNGNNNYIKDEDGSIIIEDDDDFPCSQLLCHEPPSTNVNGDILNDSIFCTIKKELEELDRPEDGRVYACVDLVEADDDEGSQEWMLNDEDEEISKSVTQSNIPEQEPKPPQKSSKNKYSIPPVISPHIEIKTRISKAKIPEKRKIVEKTTESVKKIKTSSFYDKKNVKDAGWKRKSKEEASKESKEQILEIRKRKLKEIADKKEAEEIAITVAKCKTIPKVKVSASRGNFLTENIDIPSTSKATSIQVPKSIKVTSAQPKATPCINNNAKNVPYSKPTSNRHTLYEPTGNSHVYNEPSTSYQNTNIVHHPTPFVPNAVIPVHRGTRNDIPEILIRYLNWKAIWMHNFNSNASPPIYDKTLSRMTRNFSGYKDYYNTVMPLLELELWTYIVKGFSEEHEPRKTKFIGKIENETKFHNYTELYCLTYISKDQSDKLIHIKEEDAVVVQFAFRRNNNPKSETLPMFGYVTEVHRKILNDRDFMDRDLGQTLRINPHASLTFKILVQAYEGIVDASNKNIHIKIITNLVPTTRIIRSVKYLESSPLCEHVLKPTLALYKFRNVRQEALLSREKLNEAQYSAVMEATHMCLRKEPGICLIEGPPGTGKSTVIINIIQQILLRKSKNKKTCILVVAPSNAAIDELTIRLINLKPNLQVDDRKNIKLVRLGPYKMIHSAVQDYSLDELAKRNVRDTFLASNHKTKMSSKIISLQQEMARLKENGYSPQAESTPYHAMKAELDRTCKQVIGRTWIDNIKHTESTLLGNATIICTTLSSCVAQRMQGAFKGLKKIQCCIVDEATQSTEPESLIPLMLGIDKLVLVGDPKQLPAVTLSKEAKDCAYGQSLFLRIMSNFETKVYNPVQMLNIQYRMHPAICEFPNKTFYGGKLKCADSVKIRRSKLDILKPYLVLNFKMEHMNSQEYLNEAEIDCVIKLLDAIVLNIRDSCAYSIGIVTPYNNQKEAIKRQVYNRKFKRNMSISVNTVDSFQGQEKDIMIMSCVRDYSNSFIRDKQRLNVAMTRAIHALYIIGTESLLKSCASLGEVYDDAKKRYLIQLVGCTTSTIQLSNMIKRRR